MGYQYSPTSRIMAIVQLYFGMLVAGLCSARHSMTWLSLKICIITLTSEKNRLVISPILIYACFMNAIRTWLKNAWPQNAKPGNKNRRGRRSLARSVSIREPEGGCASPQRAMNTVLGTRRFSARRHRSRNPGGEASFFKQQTRADPRQGSCTPTPGAEAGWVP